MFIIKFRYFWNPRTVALDVLKTPSKQPRCSPAGRMFFLPFFELFCYQFRLSNNEFVVFFELSFRMLLIFPKSPTLLLLFLAMLISAELWEHVQIHLTTNKLCLERVCSGFRSSGQLQQKINQNY